MEDSSEIAIDTNIEITEIEGKGRCVLAATEMKKGDIIFEEDPIISCQFAWNKDYQYRACGHCMCPLETVEENVARLSGNECFELPFLEYDKTNKANHKTCGFCGEEYCSELCRSIAWHKYHRFLCHKNEESEPLVQLIEYWKQIHYPPETMNIMMMARIIATIQLAEDKAHIYNALMQFCHQLVSDDHTSYILLGQKNQYKIDEMWRMFSMALQPRCDALNKNVFTDTLLTREGFIKLLSLIGRNGQGIGTSSLSAWVSTIEKLDLNSSEKETVNNLIDNIYSAVEKRVGPFMDNEGSGLYMKQSCINHSCAPNAKVGYRYNNFRLSVVAKRQIMPGEEISINYLDKCARKRSCHSRRKLLRDFYLFTCMCPKCTVESLTEADKTSDEEEEEDEECQENTV